MALQSPVTYETINFSAPGPKFQDLVHILLHTDIKLDAYGRLRKRDFEDPEVAARGAKVLVLTN